MSYECPVCKGPIAWHRVFRTTAWTSFQCAACGSTLTIDAVRRIIAILGLVVLFLFITQSLGLYQRYGTLELLAVLVAVLAPYHFFGERLRVLERRGFRCRRCGYDLQGQVEPRCPECSLELNSEEVEKLRTIASFEEGAVRPRRWTWRTWVAVAILSILVASQIAGIIVWRRTAARPPTPAPPPTTSPTAPSSKP